MLLEAIDRLNRISLLLDVDRLSFRKAAAEATKELALDDVDRFVQSLTAFRTGDKRFDEQEGRAPSPI